MYARSRCCSPRLRLTALLLGTALGRGSTWATAGATLVGRRRVPAAARGVQDAVDRRFRRARYDALRRIAAFLEDLRAAREPEAIEPLLRDLLGDPTLELRFFLPESEVYVDAAGCRPDSEATPGAHPDRARGRTGRGSCCTSPTGRGARSARTLVEAGGLAIEIARLRVELRRQLDEVEASRARIVSAGYAERRRIERDLHDGAQQRLVSIGLELRHAQHQLGPLGRARSRGVRTRDRDHELRELAQGLPPSQLDAGLGAGAARARRAGAAAGRGPRDRESASAAGWRPPRTSSPAKG